MNSSDSPSLATEKQPWHEVDRGLRQVVAGYVAVFLGGLFSLFFFFFAAQPGTAARLGLPDRELLEVFGMLGAGLGAMAYFVALLLGQWRCLKYTPSTNGTRECLFACIVFLGLAVLMGLCYIASQNNVFHQPEKFVIGRETMGMINTALAASVIGLLLLNFLIFNHYLQIVRGCFEERSSNGAVDSFFLFAALLIGATIGLFMHWVHLPYRGLAAGCLVLAWVGCFGWHLARIARLRQRIAKRLAGGETVQTPQQTADLYVPKKLSGVRRALRV
jgi:hypothetical protein